MCRDASGRAILAATLALSHESVMLGRRGQAMTEAEWLTATDSFLMHSYIRETTKDSPRKCRLASCGIFRLIRRATFGEQEAFLLNLGEAFADDPGLADRVNEHRRDNIPDTFPFDVCYPPEFGNYNLNSVARVVSFMQDRLGDLWWEQRPTFNDDDEDDAQKEAGRQFRRQANVVGATVLRDIFGNPFRPVTVDRARLTSTVTAIARQMYESRDFSAMPILADALQDAGCGHADILAHCRGDGPHVRGCWVVDLILGKQ
jgi:hypothetical protein